jgi:hypothetical protein
VLAFASRRHVSALEEVRRETFFWASADGEHWSQLQVLLADNFTFTSPIDAHISTGAYKKGCWDTQIDFIDHFDLGRVFGNGNEAFVKYLCHTKSKTGRLSPLSAISEENPPFHPQ